MRIKYERQVYLNNIQFIQFAAGEVELGCTKNMLDAQFLPVFRPLNISTWNETK